MFKQPFFCAFLLALLLSACATLPPESRHAHITPALLAQYQTHQQSLESFVKWQASGQMAMITKEERQSSRMNWQQSVEFSHLSLTTMLGITILEASQNQDGAEISADGQIHKGESLEQLIAQLTGYRMPVQAMPRWLTGNTDLNQASNLGLDANGYLLRFQQDLPDWGLWQVSYSGYYPATDTLPPLPSRITLKHPDITIKLKINKWSSL